MSADNMIRAIGLIERIEEYIKKDYVNSTEREIIYDMLGNINNESKPIKPYSEARYTFLLSRFQQATNNAIDLNNYVILIYKESHELYKIVMRRMQDTFTLHHKITSPEKKKKNGCIVV